jgi:hypothetical protein
MEKENSACFLHLNWRRASIYGFIPMKPKKVGATLGVQKRCLTFLNLIYQEDAIFMQKIVFIIL